MYRASKNEAASTAAQFELNAIMAAMTTDWLTNHIELNTNTYNSTTQSKQPNTNNSALKQSRLIKY